MMDIHTATELAYKNGYAKGYEDGKGEIEALRAFKEYFDGLYGEGLEVANWHLNGDLEPFDSFYESAIEEYTKKYTEVQT